MKVTVDQDKCVSSGQCVLNASDVFDQRDDDGVVVLLDDEPGRRASKTTSAKPPRPARPWPSTSRNEKAYVRHIDLKRSRCDR